MWPLHVSIATIEWADELIEQCRVTAREERPTARDIVERQSTIWCIHVAHYDCMTAASVRTTLQNTQQNKKKHTVHGFNVTEVNSTCIKVHV